MEIPLSLMMMRGSEPSRIVRRRPVIGESAQQQRDREAQQALARIHPDYAGEALICSSQSSLEQALAAGTTTTKTLWLHSSQPRKLSVPAGVGVPVRIWLAGQVELTVPRGLRTVIEAWEESRVIADDSALLIAHDLAVVSVKRMSVEVDGQAQVTATAATVTASGNSVVNAEDSTVTALDDATIRQADNCVIQLRDRSRLLNAKKATIIHVESETSLPAPGNYQRVIVRDDSHGLNGGVLDLEDWLSERERLGRPMKVCS